MKRLVLVALIILSMFFLFGLKGSDIFPGYSIKFILKGGQKIKLYVADTDEKKSKGLSTLTKLPQNEGMIFNFKDKGFYPFWMKNMNFSLDFVFIDEYRVVDTIENVTPASFPKIFTAAKKFDKAIELNSGTISSLKINKGDEINLE